ncbi:MAG: hypothetical protein J6S24_03830 [Lentisphaeria bacterium]|nr:hypothetical protein [Lentisphaeria bacterium]
MRKVLIPTKLDKFAADWLIERNYNCILDAATPIADLFKANPDAEVVIVRSEKITPELIDLLPELKLIVRAGAGFNTIDIKYARKKNIDVMNTPGANSNGVAEEVVAMMLAGSRFLVEADISTRAGNWEKSKFLGKEVTGKTVGILGLGHIGQLVVKRLSGFEVKVLGYDPFLSPVLAEKLGVELASVEKIFSECDYITLHIPENDETRGMINAKLFSLMKPGAMLVNCARAGVVNEDDLRAAKAEKKILFCNDVYPKDAEGPKSVADIADIMLPHLGANTKEANLCAARKAAEQTIAYFEQGVTSCVVNKALPDGLDAKFQKLAYVLTALGSAYLGCDNPSRVETSFYGDLTQFAAWMTPAIAAGISSDFAVTQSPKDAEKFFSEAGVELINREADNAKGYGNAMTIDLFTGSNPINKAGARGTITENKLMVTRLGDFDELYLDPAGNHLFVEYTDAPGVIGIIAGILGVNNINILDIRAPQSSDGKRALSVLKTSVNVPADIICQISEAVKAVRAFSFVY